MSGITLKIDAAQLAKDRFFSKVRKESKGCWIWLAGCDKDGYGRFKLNGKRLVAHRVSWEWATGKKLDTKIHLHHRSSCPKNCVNPKHLKPIPLNEHTRLHNRERARLRVAGIDVLRTL